MRDILSDLVRQTSSMFDVIKITGTTEDTKIQAVDKEKTLFLQARLPSIPEFYGEFGVSNLRLLEGLLDFTSYKVDGASITVERAEKNNKGETVTALVFRDANKKGATYRTMSPEMVGEQAVIANIPWDVTVTPQRAKVAEFTQLAGLFGEVERHFNPITEDGALLFCIGASGGSNHRVSMVFEPVVEGEIKAAMNFSTPQFLSVIKNAGQNPTTMRICERGVLGLTVTTQHGSYNYYIRARRE